MRADRLLALTMLLQTRNGMTARELADELEVSERTIYRDLTALSTAGIPVYTERGPGGGCFLLDEFRTDLTGLTTDEARALFMLSIPAALYELGVSSELKTALLKLSAALPESRRTDETYTRQRIHLDSSPWFHQVDEALPHLQTIHQALWNERKLHLASLGFFQVELEQELDPFGLVAKANDWYLVGGREDGMRVVRVAEITSAEILEATFTRPPDFDLAAFWKEWCRKTEALRPQFHVSARLATEAQEFLPFFTANSTVDIQVPVQASSADGWMNINLVFETFETARAWLLNLGGAIEVLEPQALRLAMKDYAEQITARYLED